MGQCCSKQDKYRQKGTPEKEHKAENGKEKATPTKEDEKRKAEPENVTNKADTGEVKERVNDKNPDVGKKDVSVKPDNDLGVKPPTSTPPSNKPSTGTNKQSGKKKKSAAKSGNSSSSEWTDSSESSDSSDSSYGDKTFKVKKTGNTTVYSKSKSKTKVMGNSYTVDNRKGVLNITKIGHQTVVEKLFSGTGYSLEEACDFEKRQQNEIPAGCMVNLREKHLVQEYVFNAQIRSDATAWVGIIKFEGIIGTCFRVGDKKIMTALHVVRAMLEKGYMPVHAVHQNHQMPNIFVKSGQQESDGGDDTTHIAALSKLKNAFVDFSYIKDDQYQYKEHTVFKLKLLTSIRDVPFFDNETDCIVLEILPNTAGTPMPLPFSVFSVPKLEEGFHIIGHPGGSKKIFDHVDRFIAPGKEQTKKDIHTIKSESKKFLARHGKDEHEYPFDVGQNINSKERFLFHCTSFQGASGAPGVVVDDEGHVIVVTMLLCGFPDWFYDTRSASFRADWPKAYCVEQGASMPAIYCKMLREKPELCNEIFRRTQ